MPTFWKLRGQVELRRSALRDLAANERWKDRSVRASNRPLRGFKFLDKLACTQYIHVRKT